MKTDTADPNETSHAGDFGDFLVTWNTGAGLIEPGWYIFVIEHIFGPYATSQAAFGAAKDCIDKLLQEEE